MGLPRPHRLLEGRGTFVFFTDTVAHTWWHGIEEAHVESDPSTPLSWKQKGGRGHQRSLRQCERRVKEAVTEEARRESCVPGLLSGETQEEDLGYLFSSKGQKSQPNVGNPGWKGATGGRAAAS